MKKILLLLVALYGTTMLAQTTITGSVYDIYLEPLASIKVVADKGTTTTDADGNFSLSVKLTFPFTISIEGVGYKSQKIEITDFEEVSVVLEKQSKLNEIVVSASRTSERVIESPVTIERHGISDFKQGAGLSFYDDLANLKDVDIHTSGFGVKIINTRAFASLDNSRFVQLVDGADTANPSYNFSLGNTLGLNDLDVASVEILPGAASALYGANAFNGILIMNSKNPFDYQGISASVKSGLTDQNSGAFNDTSIRMAYAFNDKFAVKANFNFQKSQEWEANDQRNTNGILGGVIAGNRVDNPDFNGVNVNGDEVSVSFQDVLLSLEGVPAEFGGFPVGTSSRVPSFNITRTGFNEIDLTDGEVETRTFDGSIYYRPYGKEDIELVFNSKFAGGDNSYYKINSRIAQKNASTQQHKLDFKYKSLLSARAYYTRFDQGDQANNLLLLGADLNEQVQDFVPWIIGFTSAYTNTYLNALDFTVASEANILALAAAREFADSTRPDVGTAEFAAILNSTRNRLLNEEVGQGGSRLKNNTELYHGDLNLDLSEYTRGVGLQLGGSYRRYQLNSSGQLYTDLDGGINYNEFGIYAQAGLKFLDKRLALTSSVRFDKSENFDGNFSPRVSVTYAGGKSRNHNFRGSFQTAFRNPTSEDQFSDNSLGNRVTLVGNIEENYNRFSAAVNFVGRDVFAIAAQGGQTSTVLLGNDVINNSFTTASAQTFLAAVQNDLDNTVSLIDAYNGNLNLLEQAEIEAVTPEQVQTLELGYRGEFDIAGQIFEIDANGYYSRFEDFITTELVTTPFYGDVTDGSIDAGVALKALDAETFAFRVNSDEVLNFYGIGATISTKLFNDFDFSANYQYAGLEDQKLLEETIRPGFNTANHRVKASVGKAKLLRSSGFNLGFNVSGRWQDEFIWQTPYLSSVIEERTEIDAQINFSVPSLKSNFKFGGTNLTGKSFTSAAGIGAVGSLYYINWTINN